MPARSTLSVVVKQRRQALGWTQEELAERISTDDEYVRQSEISRIESGKITLPRRERLERLADVLDIPLGELLARSGWSGADEHFQPQPRPSSAAAQSEPAHQSTLENEHQLSVSRESDRRHRIEAPVDNIGRMTALRRALHDMRAESNRLERNRERKAEIMERFERPSFRQEARNVDG